MFWKIVTLLILTTFASAQLRVRKAGIITPDYTGVVSAPGFVAPFWGNGYIGEKNNPFTVGYFDRLAVSRITGLSGLAVDSLTQQLRLPAIETGNFIVTSLHFTPFGLNQVGQSGLPATEVHTERIYADKFIGNNAVGYTDLDKSGRYGLDTLDIKSSDKIFFLGDSYTENLLTHLNENSVSQWSEYNDFYIENFSKSGYDVLGLIGVLQGDDVVRSYPFSFDVMRPKYIVLETFLNDMNETKEQFYFGYRKILMQIRALGAVPIIALPAMHDFSEDTYPARYNKIREIARELNAILVDGQAFSYPFYFRDTAGNDIEKPQSLDGTDPHPNSMGSRYLAEAMKRKLNWLKPRKAVKVYRADETGISGLAYTVWRDSLRFANDDSRRKRWDEISLSQEYGKIKTGQSSTVLPSEYGKLANNAAVTFSDGAALFEFTVPFTEGDYNTIKFDVTAGTSANYDVMALRYWNTADDTATFRTYGLAMPQLVTWDTLATFSSATDLSVTIDTLDRYLNGNKMAIAVFRTSKASFTLTSSPRLIYTAPEDVQGNEYIQTAYKGAEIVAEPYFDADGQANWTSTGVSYSDGDVVTWTFPGGGASYSVRTPMLADDTLAVIGALTTRLSRTIDLSAYDMGAEFELELWVQGSDPDYNDVDSLQVDIHYESYPATIGQTYTSFLEVPPVWMPMIVRFRKSVGNTVTVDLLPVAGSSDVYVSKVGCKQVIYTGRQ